MEKTMKFQVKSACAQADLDLLESASLTVYDLVGDIVELGTFEGASAFALARSNPDKRLFACDLFGGNPYPDRNEFAHLAIDDKAFEEVVKKTSFFPNIILVRGMHEVTVPLLPVEKISFLHMDSDHYESHKIGLEILGPKVVSGGIIAFHDWSFVQVRQAVLDVINPDDWEFMLGPYEYVYENQGMAFLRRV